MALAKPVRGLALLAVVIWCFFLYQIFFDPALDIRGPGNDYATFDRDPNLDRKSTAVVPSRCPLLMCVLFLAVTYEPAGELFRASDRYAVDATQTDRINATLLALVRNEEADAMVQSMLDLERTWNRKFNYPWTFFNDEPFTEEFKKKTSAATKAKCFYGTH